jgi:cytochrome c-type biogenesis protein
MTATPNLFLSFVAGLLSFLSPCILPLLPSYISFIGGMSLPDLREKRNIQFSLITKTLLFVAGFSIVFVSLGIIFAGSGFLLGEVSQIINAIAGGIVILLGLNLIFDFWKFLNLEKKIHLKQKPRGYVGSLFIGMAFGAGWSPCVGPILAAILFLAGNSANIGTGVLYLSAYSIGLGLPFILVSIFFSPLTERLKAVRKHMRAIQVISGVFLILIGILIISGQLQQINTAFASLGRNLSTWSAEKPLLSRLVFSLSLFFIALIPYMRPITILIKNTGGSSSDAETKPALFRPLRVTFSTIFLVFGILEAIGLIDIATAMGDWFTYQGI